MQKAGLERSESPCRSQAVRKAALAVALMTAIDGFQIPAVHVLRHDQGMVKHDSARNSNMLV